MKGEKILDTIPKLQLLDEDKLNFISSIIDSCLIVQSLENFNFKLLNDIAKGVFNDETDSTK
ncbi:hypothetical protein [Clostridium diolis]|uniref:hypothetical protein n=1 Tax=Clostridium diolis TaxID=223919 RepID=UPI003AF59B18